MAEAIQADRDAAASAYYAWFNGSPVIPTKMEQGQADDHTMVQAFARHRLEERNRIKALIEGKLNLHKAFVEQCMKDNVEPSKWIYSAMVELNYLLREISK